MEIGRRKEGIKGTGRYINASGKREGRIAGQADTVEVETPTLPEPSITRGEENCKAAVELRGAGERRGGSKMKGAMRGE